VKPGFAGDGVVLAVDGFVEDVGVVAAEAGEFLLKPDLSLGHHFLVTSVPEFIPMGESARDAAAGGFDNVLADCLRIKRGKLAVPVNSLFGFAGHLGCLIRRHA